MIKVLQVTPQMDYGGVSTVVRNFYSFMDHDEIKFDFITHGPEEEYHADFVSSGSKMYYFDTLGKVGYTNYKRQILDSFDMRSYDIVHIHLGDLTGVYAMAFRACGAKRIINHAHGSKPVSKNRKYFEWLLRRLAVKEADVCIGCGVDAGNFMFGKGKYKLICNGIDYEKFNNVEDERIEAIKNKIGLDNRWVVTNVGNYQAVKNQKFLIEVVAKMSTSVPEILLLLVGSGNEYDNLLKTIEKENVSNNVILTGTITDVPALLKASDVFTLASIHEGLPMSSIEAQATGIPCVFSSTIDHGVDIGNKYNYFLPIDNGVDCWVDTLTYLYNSKAWDKSGEIHNRIVNHGFSIKENAVLLRNEYMSLADK